MAEQNINIQLPKELNDYLWVRYMPTSTLFTYAMISLLDQKQLKGEEAVKFLDENVMPRRQEHPVMKVEKMKALVKLGKKYPMTIEDDIKLLEDYQLINVDRNEGVYSYKNPIQRPEELFEYDEEEKATVETLKFELKYQDQMNMFLTFLLNNNGKIQAPVKHIIGTTRMKVNDLRAVVGFLMEEGSVEFSAKKTIDKIKKDDSVKINIVEEVFNAKRVVIQE